MKLYFPNSAFLGNIDGTFLQNFDSSNPDELEVTFNQKWTWSHPVVLSMTAALAYSIKDKSKIKSQQPDAKSRNYLERMELIKALNLQPIPVKSHEPAGRFIPLTQIKTPKELTKFIEDVVPLLHTSQYVADSIKYVISELVTNVFEHANSPVGAVVCAQYFNKSDKVSIGVADTGIGVKESITFSHTAKTDLEAIRLALKPGITGATQRAGGNELNAGAGLFFIKSIAKSNRNFFVLYSGDALYKLLKNPPNKAITLYADPFEDRHSARESLPYWKGTAAGIDISTQSSQSFDSLLELIRKVYRLEKKSKIKERYKKARFI